MVPGTYATPGTYVAEVPFAVRVMDSLPSGVAAFVGTAIQGPQNEPTLVNSFDAFRGQFGDLHPSSDMSYAVAHFFENGGRIALIVRVEGAGNGVPSAADIIGSPEHKAGLHALDSYELFDVLVVPNRSEPEVQAAMIEVARECRAFAILDLPESVNDPSSAINWLAANEALGSSNAATYFPRVVCKDQAQGGFRRSFANSGLIAGLYARTDDAKGVWEAPAGSSATLSGVDRLEYKLSEREIALLNPLGLNVLRVAPQAGSVVWGARTLVSQSQGSELKYVPVSRLFLFLQRNLQRALWEIDYRQNSEALCEEVRVQIDLYMRRLFLQGAFRGATPSEAYTVDCSPGFENNVAITIGFAPSRARDFITMTIVGTAPFI